MQSYLFTKCNQSCIVCLKPRKNDLVCFYVFPQLMSFCSKQLVIQLHKSQSGPGGVSDADLRTSPVTCLIENF